LELTALFSRLRRKPSAVIFDWDNTLVDTWPIIHDALSTTLTAFDKVPWTLAETKVRVRRSMRDSFPEMFGGSWQDASEVFYARYEEIHADRLEPAAGAGEMLSALHDMAIYIGVVSNKRGDFLRVEAAHLGWHEYFGRIVGANDAERDKPARDPVDLVLSGDAGLRDGEIWFVGDADIDLECAIGSDCVPVLMRREAPGLGEFVDHPPTLHFPDCKALFKYVGKL